jgi:acyl carrier protein
MAGQATMDRLNEVFRDVFDDPALRISEEMTAKNVNGWDSLNHINLVVAVERAFGIKFTTKEVLTYKNVGEFAAAVERKQAPAQT